MALDLCQEIAEFVEELEELAKKLAIILRAEGDLHEVSKHATLRACKNLINLIEDESKDQEDKDQEEDEDNNDADK